MITIDIVDKYTEIYKKEILQNCADLLNDYPIDSYLDEIKSYREFLSYNYLSPKLKTVFEEIHRIHGAHTYALYQKFAISHFINDAIERLHNRDIPVSIVQIYHKWFERILNDFTSKTDNYYHFSSDAFQKDLSVCTLRLHPTGGCWAVDASGTMNRKLLFGGGFKQFCCFLKLFLF